MTSELPCQAPSCNSAAKHTYTSLTNTDWCAGFVLLANSAYAQATIMWLTITPLLYKFSNYCETRYGQAVRHMPLETAAVAPQASVPAVVYMPPALRKGAAGWYPEFGKVLLSSLPLNLLFDDGEWVPPAGNEETVSVPMESQSGL